METKKCSICGTELPLSAFANWDKKDGTKSYLHCCLKCQRHKASIAHNKKKKQSELSRINLDVLIEEIQRRGVQVVEKIQTKDLIFEVQKRGHCVLNEDNILKYFSTVNKLKELING